MESPPLLLSGADAGGGAISSDAKACAIFEEPFHLLKPSEGNTSLIVDPVALRRLASIGPMTVLPLIGCQRGGKSTLMNLLHSRRLTGFQTGHYLDSQTHGVWVWPRPHPRKQGVTVLLVDCEGLDSPNVPQHYGWLVAAVTVLMADVFMYQTRASIEQSAAERLDMILKVAEQLRRSSGSKSDKAGVFLWLLRDHQLQLKRTPKEELERFAPDQVGAVCRSFADYDCVPLPRPASDDILGSLDRHAFQDLKPDFQEEFVVLERRLWDLLAQPRQFCGEELSGHGLSEMLQHYITAVSERQGMLGAICDMPTQLELLRQLAGRRAIDAGVSRYKEVLRSDRLIGANARLPVQPSILLNSHSIAESAALESFDGSARSAGVEGDALLSCRRELEEQLACWKTQLRPAAPMQGSKLDSSDASEGLDFCNNALEGIVPPCVTQVQCLKSGLLNEIWTENARRSGASFKAWLSSTKESKDAALSALRTDPNDSVDIEVVLSAYYAKVRETFGQRDGESAGTFGPWPTFGPEAFHDDPHNYLLNLVQDGDEVVMRAADVALQQVSRTLQVQVQAVSLFESRVCEIDSVCATNLARVMDCEQEVSRLREVQLSRLGELERKVETLDARHVQALEALAEKVDFLKSSQLPSLVRQNSVLEASVLELNEQLKASNALFTERCETWFGRTTQMKEQVAAIELLAVERWENLVERTTRLDEQVATSNSFIVERCEALERLCTSQGTRLSELVVAWDSRESAVRGTLNEHHSTSASLQDQLATFRAQVETIFEHTEREREGTCRRLAELQDRHGQFSKLVDELDGASTREANEQRLQDVRDQASNALTMAERFSAVAEGFRDKLQTIEELLKQAREPLDTDIPQLKEAVARVAGQVAAIEETAQKNDMAVIWESFAQLATQLSQLQSEMDSMMKHANPPTIGVKKR